MKVEDTMEERRKMNRITEILFIILACIVIVGLIVGAAYLIERTQDPQRNSCKNLCIDYNATFVEYESGFFSPSECWCKTKQNKPLRVT